MPLKFTATEVRVLGCLIEKERTTPEGYPMSLNGLTRACNQKSNREPVMDLSETEVQEALDSLARQMLVSSRGGADSRVSKYSHRLRDRLTPEFDFDPAELAVVSVLLLRGAQTPGEIRTRAERLHPFEDTQTVMASLRKLSERSDGPYVRQLARQPGQKEVRFVHLFAGDVTEEVAVAAPARGTGASDRLQALEQRVQQLQTDLESLEQKFEAFARQFD